MNKRINNGKVNGEKEIPLDINSIIKISDGGGKELFVPQNGNKFTDEK